MAARRIDLDDAHDMYDAHLSSEWARLSDDFVVALPLGEDAKFEDGTVGDALQEVVCSSYAQMLNDIVVAAAGSEDPVLVALIKALGNAYADIVLTKKEGVAA